MGGKGILFLKMWRKKLLVFYKQTGLKLTLVKWLKYKLRSNTEHNGIFFTSSQFCYFNVLVLYREVIFESFYFFICMKTAFHFWNVSLRHSRPPPKPQPRWMPRKAHREGGRSVVPWLLSALMRNTCTECAKSQPPTGHRPRALTCTLNRLKEKLWPPAVPLGQMARVKPSRANGPNSQIWGLLSSWSQSSWEISSQSWSTLRQWIGPEQGMPGGCALTPTCSGSCSHLCSLLLTCSSYCSHFSSLFLETCPVLAPKCGAAPGALRILLERGCHHPWCGGVGALLRCCGG